MKKTLSGPGGIRIVLDSSEIFPNDPGQGTPALVTLFGATGTYWCASSEGELLDGGTTRKLTEAQCRWLNDQEDAVTDFLRANVELLEAAGVPEHDPNQNGD